MTGSAAGQSPTIASVQGTYKHMRPGTPITSLLFPMYSFQRPYFSTFAMANGHFVLKNNTDIEFDQLCIDHGE